MFSTVSIMPGMENFAPDLTLTSSGSAGSPSLRPMALSSFSRWAWISASSPSGVLPRCR